MEHFEAKVLAISAAKIVVKIFSNINQTLSLAALMLHAKNPNTVERCYFFFLHLMQLFCQALVIESFDRISPGKFSEQFGPGSPSDPSVSLVKTGSAGHSPSTSL